MALLHRQTPASIKSNEMEALSYYALSKACEPLSHSHWPLTKALNPATLTSHIIKGLSDLNPIKMIY